MPIEAIFTFLPILTVVSFMFLSALAVENALSPIVTAPLSSSSVMLPSNVTVLRYVRDANADVPRVRSSLLSPLKVTVSTEVQPENAFSPILVTQTGMITEVIPVQSLNAFASMDVIPLGMESALL